MEISLFKDIIMLNISFSVFSTWIGIIKLCYKFRVLFEQWAGCFVCVVRLHMKPEYVFSLNVLRWVRAQHFILSDSLYQFSPLFRWILISCIYSDVFFFFLLPLLNATFACYKCMLLRRTRWKWKRNETQ